MTVLAEKETAEQADATWSEYFNFYIGADYFG